MNRIVKNALLLLFGLATIGCQSHAIFQEWFVQPMSYALENVRGCICKYPIATVVGTAVAVGVVGYAFGRYRECQLRKAEARLKLKQAEPNLLLNEIARISASNVQLLAEKAALLRKIARRESTIEELRGFNVRIANDFLHRQNNVSGDGALNASGAGKRVRFVPDC